MELYLFYLVRGWKFDELLGLSFLEKTALRCAQERWYEEEQYNHAAAITQAMQGTAEGG